MIIGRMKERVTIQSPTEVRTSVGGTTLTWATLETVWASVDGLSTRDILQAQQANLVATHRIRIRYRSDVTHTQRIVWRGRTMEIASVVERDNRTALEILAREVQ
ncbi:MAG: head-tail adaptor protein [Caulobacteraceae bacterium]|nr:head-tail adaptor protein [Caulobacteraceae bacterium]